MAPGCLVAGALAAAGLLFVAALASPARADDAPVCNQSAPDNPGQPFDKALLGDLAGLRSPLSAYGLTVGLIETDEVLGNLTGGTRQGAIYEGLTDVNLKFDLRQRFDWPGVVCVRAFQIRGYGLTARNLGNLDTVSSIEADPTTRLFEFWYEQDIGSRLHLRIGQQAADQEFLVSTTSKLFINSTFGWPSLPSIDLPSGGPAYPLATPAIRLRVEPTDEVTVLAGVFNANPTGAPFGSNDPQSFDPSGTAFRIGDGVLALFEARYNTGDNGTYRLGAWFNSERFPSQRFASNGVSLASPLSSGTPQLLSNDYSVYGIIDQPVYADKERGEALNLFVRAMGAPGDRNLVSFYLDAGVAFQGPFGRKDDAIGFGFGYSQIGSAARGLDMDNAALTPGYLVRSREAVVEVTYQAQITEWWQLQPDFQYVISPSGTPGQRIGNAAVLGLRSSISF